MIWLITLSRFSAFSTFFCSFHPSSCFRNLHNLYLKCDFGSLIHCFLCYSIFVFLFFFRFICIGQYLTKEHSVCDSKKKKRREREREREWEWALPPPRGIDISPKEMLSPYTHAYTLLYYQQHCFMKPIQKIETKNNFLYKAVKFQKCKDNQKKFNSALFSFFLLIKIKWKIKFKLDFILLLNLFRKDVLVEKNPPPE